MNETLAEGLWLCKCIAQKHAGVAALLAEYRRLAAENTRLLAEVQFDSTLARQDAAEIERLRAMLEAKHAAPPPSCTATPNQTYTWLPGDVWSQYTAAMALNDDDMIAVVKGPEDAMEVLQRVGVTFTGAQIEQIEILQRRNEPGTYIFDITPVRDDALDDDLDGPDPFEDC